MGWTDRQWKGMAGLALLALVPDPAQATVTSDELIVTAQPRPNLFGTVVIPGPAGRWSDRWHRIATDPGRSPELEAMIAPARTLDRRAQLDFLQETIDRRIGWRSDGTQYGARTYWATAAETLASGVGDDDDRAILKFQALRALGFPQSDYYLMIGQDRVRGDYALLVARATGRWWLLEEQGDRAVLADQRTGFEPMASFGAGRTWIHGRPRKAPTSLAAVGGAPHAGPAAR